MNQPEMFLPFPEYENYYVSNKGNVYKRDVNVDRNNPYLFKRVSIYYYDSGLNKYAYFTTYSDGKDKRHSLSRVVAQLFLNTPKNVSKVIHIDGDNYNSCVENLKWKIK